MPLIQGPTSGGLLLGPGGNLAGDLNCCCECTFNQTCVDYPCVLCGLCDSQLLALPVGCADFSGPACFTVTLSGLVWDTGCRRPTDSDCQPLSGSYKFNSATMPDYVIPFGEDTGDVRNPESMCNLNLTNICGRWGGCDDNPPPVNTRQVYFNDNCTGFVGTANVFVGSATLVYQFIGATRRFILEIDTPPITGAAELPIFYGVANFDARNCANYAAFPLVFVNQLTDYSCTCGDGVPPHGLKPAAIGGTATLALRCDHPLCSSFGLLP